LFWVSPYPLVAVTVEKFDGTITWEIRKIVVLR